MKQKHEETPSSLLLLRWKGDRFLTCATHLTGTVTAAFPVHAHPSLMSLWSHLQNDPERPDGGSLPGPAGPWPSPWLWMDSRKRSGKPRLAPIHIQTLLRVYGCVVSLFFSSIRSLMWCTLSPIIFYLNLFFIRNKICWNNIRPHHQRKALSESEQMNF